MECQTRTTLGSVLSHQAAYEATTGAATDTEVATAHVALGNGRMLVLL